MERTPQDSGPADVRVPETPRASDPLENGQLPGISILDRLIKTCPVWLQLCMGAPQVQEILRREASGVFLVTRDAEIKCMVLWVRSAESRGAADLLHYNIREEKTMMYVEGSMLVFKDIFKLVAFYCISRDILPSVLKLPPAISAARSLHDLEEISNLGTGFWDSSSSSQWGTSAGNLQTHDSGRTQRASRELCDCACEVELAAGHDRLWFVSPIFIEECGNVASSDQLPLTNCIAKHETRVPQIMHRRPPPPPPTLHKPPLPSLPPSAPPPNYIHPPTDSSPLRSPAQSRPSASKGRAPKIPSAETPTPSGTVAETFPTSQTSSESPPPSVTLTVPPISSGTSVEPPPLSRTSAEPPPPSVTLTEPPPSSGTLTEPTPLSGTSAEPPPPSVTSAESFGTSAEPAPPFGTSAEPAPPFGTSAELAPPSVTSAEPPPPSATSAEPPPTCGTSAEPPPLSGTPTQSCSPEPPKSLLLGSSPKTSVHNLVDLQDLSSVEDHPICSARSDPTPVPAPDHLSSSGSHLGSSPLPSQLDSSLLTFTDEEQAVGAPPGPSDLDFAKEPLKDMKINVFCNDSPQTQGSPTATPVRAPPAVPRRRPSGKVPENQISISSMKEEEEARRSPSKKTPLTFPEKRSQMVESGKKNPPVPPPRIKKLASRTTSVTSEKGRADARGVLETESQRHCGGDKVADRKVSRQKRLPTTVPKTSDQALTSPGSDPTMVTPEADSYSTSSAEEDSEPPASTSIKKSHSFMLDRAKNRLSIVAITNVFSAFMSADRKLQKRIGELAHDKDSYFGNLVQDYKAYSLEMMAKQSSSTEMLQEIRLMMTQLKSYLVQSAELKAMVDYTLYTDDKIDAIVEAALCKCVLKPLKSAIECYLREIHNKDGSLRLLTENQQVIQDTTTTDLGVTTSVPDSGVMEKILHKFGTMHKTYSPEKKITYLLKACKLIYDSMAAGNPGKHHGADDFLPVLMYVLAQCDLVALLLDVEYMMELMDPALQLGEGSYYLTTTYGALEHIKNYDKITVTRQLSVEVQDSIHRWERRRTLNKAKVSRSSIQDFITIALEELDSKTRTLATKPDMSAAEVLRQCAEKFEVSAPEQYGLFVLVNERCLRLPEDAVPQQVKSRLLKNEQKLDFHFLYRRRGAQDTVMDELDFL